MSKVNRLTKLNLKNSFSSNQSKSIVKSKSHSFVPSSTELLTEPKLADNNNKDIPSTTSINCNSSGKVNDDNILSVSAASGYGNNVLPNFLKGGLRKSSTQVSFLLHFFLFNF